MMDAMKAQQTIDRLCDRTDLEPGSPELTALATARRALRPDREFIEAFGRTWELTHYLYGGVGLAPGTWGVASWRSGDICYGGLTSHGTAASRDEAIGIIERDGAAGRYHR